MPAAIREASKGQPYFDYFSLPGNEHHYDVDLGLVHLYALNSNYSEPDGMGPKGKQALWLKNRLASSRACLDVVVMHYPLFSSGSLYGSFTRMQWPYKEWGADAVMAGHEHLYQRLNVGGLPGLGGDDRTPSPARRFATMRISG